VASPAPEYPFTNSPPSDYVVWYAHLRVRARARVRIRDENVIYFYCFGDPIRNLIRLSDEPVLDMLHRLYRFVRVRDGVDDDEGGVTLRRLTDLHACGRRVPLQRLSMLLLSPTSLHVHSSLPSSSSLSSSYASPSAHEDMRIARLLQVTSLDDEYHVRRNAAMPMSYSVGYANFSPKE
jgi:hypothetical protein